MFFLFQASTASEQDITTTDQRPLVEYDVSQESSATKKKKEEQEKKEKQEQEQEARLYLCCRTSG